MRSEILGDCHARASLRVEIFNARHALVVERSMTEIILSFGCNFSEPNRINPRKTQNRII